MCNWTSVCAGFSHESGHMNRSECSNCGAVTDVYPHGDFSAMAKAEADADCSCEMFDMMDELETKEFIRMCEEDDLDAEANEFYDKFIR